MLDPTFKQFTLQNEAIKSLARDLGVHKDPQGAFEITETITQSHSDYCELLSISIWN